MIASDIVSHPTPCVSRADEQMDSLMEAPGQLCRYKFLCLVHD